MVLRIMTSIVALLMAAGVASAVEWTHPSLRTTTVEDDDVFLFYRPGTNGKTITGLLLKQIFGYTHPASHPATMITEDETHRFITDAQKLYWDAKEPAIGVKGTAFNKDFGTTADRVTEGDDPRLSDSRTPLAHDQAATTITYNGTTVAAVLDELSYVPIAIASYTLSGSASNVTQEIGGSYTITGNGLAWATNKTATTQTINGTPRTSPYMPTSPVSTTQTYTLQVGDGRTTASSSRTVTFTHYRYWGVNAASSLTDIDIRALSKEFSTSRAQSRTFTAAGQYLYIAYLATGGAATITVNGFLDSSWVLVQRDFVNASGYTDEFRIYRSAYPLTGTYIVVVS